MNKIFILGVGIVALGILGFAVMQNTDKPERNAIDADNVTARDNLAGENQAGTQGDENSSTASSEYTGKLLAGTSSPYLEFNQADFDRAMSSGKIVFLDFYATWCPVCREEAPEMKKAFDALKYDNVVGFRVNYNDPDTDDAEKALARRFKVLYQHTKVILKNGEVSLKETEQWDSKQVVDAIAAIQ